MSDSLTTAVSEFCAAHLGNTVKGNMLYAHVIKSHPDIAPDTPARILRGLRDRGIVSYTVPNKKKSEYVIHEVH